MALMRAQSFLVNHSYHICLLGRCPNSTLLRFP